MERTIPIDPILEKGYNVRLLVDDFDGLIEKWSNWSEDFRSNADSLKMRKSNLKKQSH